MKCRVRVYYFLWWKVKKYIVFVQAGSSQKDKRIVLTDCCIFKIADKAKSTVDLTLKAKAVNHQRELDTENPGFEITYFKNLNEENFLWNIFWCYNMSA